MEQMTDPEWTNFLRQLYVSFPSLSEWMTRNSQDVAGTHLVWRRTLAKCKFDECVKVLDSWITGKRSTFQAYERDQVALLIRTAVEHDRSQQARHENQLTSIKSHMEDVRQKRAAYKRLPDLTAIWQQAEEVTSRWRSGEITEEEWIAERDRIASEAGK